MEMTQILLVEDEASIAKDMSDAIEKLGFIKPQVASNLAEAQDIARRTSPDIALVDLSLGVKGDGQIAARQLNEEFNLPVVFLSSQEESEKRRKGSAQNGTVIKPFDCRNLKKTIELALFQRQQNNKFILLLTDLPLPSAVIGGEPLEILAWNKGFADQFLPSEKLNVDRVVSPQKVALLSRVSKISEQVINEKKLELVECSLPTNSGVARFEISANRIDSFDQPVMLISLKEILPGTSGGNLPLETDSIFQNIFWNAPVMMMQMDQAGILRYVNNHWLQETGYATDEVQGNPLDTYLDEESIHNFQAAIIYLLSESEPFCDLHLVLISKNGQENLLTVRLSKSEGSDNAPSIIGVLHETSGRTLDDDSALSKALRDTAAALTSTLNFDEVLDQILANVAQVVPNEAANVMMIWSGVAYIVRSTGYAERGLEEAMMTLQLPINQEPHLLSMQETGMPLAVKDTLKYAGLQNQMGTDWARSIASAPLRSKGQVFGFLNLESSQPGFYNQKHADRLQAFADQAAVAIENARLYAEVQQYAITDELTAIYNRRGLYELGKREVERAHRYSRGLSAIMIDTDKFKSINDTYSHSVGDQVLRILANRLKGCIREVDILGRYGGDEFVILLPETDLQSALPVAERARLSVCETEFQTSAGDIPLAVSVGVADLSGDKLTFEALLEKADNAMFQAKTMGKNQVAS
ncbi:MAG: diguanylate cyclase [Leptolinea sp.]